jgi:hypothetical protein
MAMTRAYGLIFLLFVHFICQLLVNDEQTKEDNDLYVFRYNFIFIHRFVPFCPSLVLPFVLLIYKLSDMRCLFGVLSKKKLYKHVV